MAGLEFLGFGDSANLSWGTMLYDAYNGSALFRGAWWWFAPPGVCIALLGSGLALLNFGMDELADPRLRGLRRRRKLAKERRSHDERLSLHPPVLDVRGLSVDYIGEHGTVHAVTDVSFTLRRGEVLGLAGESGSGKSTLAYAVARLLPESAVISAGEVLFLSRRATGTAAVEARRPDQSAEPLDEGIAQVSLERRGGRLSKRHERAQSRHDPWRADRRCAA